MAVAAQLDTTRAKGRRGNVRREMRLRVPGAPNSGDAIEALIHNLSTSGLLLETSAELRLGEEIVVDLPETDRSSAKVVWTSDNLFGCKFDHPLSEAALSAARLRSDPIGPSPSHAPSPQIGESSGNAVFLGKRLKELRKQQGLSLVEFAKRMNVSRPTVWSWEAGKSAPRPSKVPCLLKILGAAGEDLYGPADAPTHPATAKTETKANPLQAAIIEAKERVATIVGTSADKVKLIIEV